MAIEFHRLVTPAYNEDTLSTTHNFINDPASNSPPGAGVPAVADGMKSGGPNDGSYFVAFGEDASTLDFNRANKALAENTDFLDDIVHRDLAVPVLLASVTPGAPVNSIVLTGDIYVGEPGEADNQRTRSGLVVLLEDDGSPLIVESPTGLYTKVLVSKIHDGGPSIIGTPADGFYTDPTIDLGTTIPSGKTYRVLYYARSSVKNQPAGILSRLRDGVFGDAGLWEAMSNNTSFYPAGSAWHDGTANPVTLLKTQVAKIITDLIADEGSDRIGSDAVAGTHLALSAGDSIFDQLGDLTGYINTNHVGGLSSVFISVKNYGAIGNGTADDYAAITAAIAAATINGGTVLFPYGVYKVSDTIVVPKNVNLLGVGPFASIIKIEASGPWVEALETSSSPASDGMNNVTGLGFEAAQLQALAIINAGTSANTVFDRCFFNGTNADAQVFTAAAAHVEIRNSYFKAGTGTSAVLDIAGATHARICGNRFTAAASGNFRSIEAGGTSHTDIVGNYFDNSPQASGAIENIVVPAGSNANVSITENRFINPTGGTALAMSLEGNPAYPIYEDHSFFDSSVTPYYLSPNGGWSITSNVQWHLGTRERRVQNFDSYGSAAADLEIDQLGYGQVYIERDSLNDLNLTAAVQKPPPGAMLTVIFHNQNTGGNIDVDFDDSDFRNNIGSPAVGNNQIRVYRFTMTYSESKFSWIQVSTTTDIGD